MLFRSSLGAAVGGLANASSNTTYIESAAGVAEGGRTGLVPVVTGLLFLGAMWLSPLASVIPAQATAPALVIVGEFDPLRDDGIAYAERLRAAGNVVELADYPGMVHPFFSMGGAVDAGRQAVTQAAQALRHALTETPPSKTAARSSASSTSPHS